MHNNHSVQMGDQIWVMSDTIPGNGWWTGVCVKDGAELFGIFPANHVTKLRLEIEMEPAPESELEPEPEPALDSEPQALLQPEPGADRVAEIGAALTAHTVDLATDADVTLEANFAVLSQEVNLGAIDLASEGFSWDEPAADGPAPGDPERSPSPSIVMI